jgi:uncharacterized protein YbbK (DUF523 family)
MIIKTPNHIEVAQKAPVRKCMINTESVNCGAPAILFYRHDGRAKERVGRFAFESTKGLCAGIDGARALTRRVIQKELLTLGGAG